MTLYWSVEQYGTRPILVNVPHAGGRWDGELRRSGSRHAERMDRPSRLKRLERPLRDRNAYLFGSSIASETGARSSAAT